MQYTPLLNLPDVYGLNVAFDTETSGLFVDDGARVSIVSAAWREEDDGPMSSGAWAFDQGQLDKTFSKPPKWLNQRDLFDQNDAPNLGSVEWLELVHWLGRQHLIGQNTKFDIHIMYAGHRRWGLGYDLADAVTWDTMLASKEIWPYEKTTSLKPTCERLGWTTSHDFTHDLKLWLNRHKVHDKYDKLQPRFDLAPWHLVAPYATKDAELTLRLAELQWSILTEGSSDGQWHTIHEQIQLSRVLVAMERRGIPFDVEACLGAAQQLYQMMDKTVDALPFKPPLPAAARRYFFDRPPTGLGLIPKRTDKGEISVAKDVMLALIEQGAPGAQEWLDYQQVHNAINMWYERWPDQCGADGRLRTSYRQLKDTDDAGKTGGTVSGRLAPERVNLMSIPHDYQLPGDVAGIRSFFHGPTALWEMDISQAEMRVASVDGGCQPLLDGFLAGLDAHDKTTMDLFGLQPSDVAWKQMRNVSKRLNFGMLYAAGVFTIGNQIEMFTGVRYAEDQVRSWLNIYRNTYPELVQAGRAAEQAVRRRARPGLHAGFIWLPGGYKRYFALHEEPKLYKAFNARIQGSVAKLMIRAMIWIEHEYPGVMLLQIHDSLIIETNDTTTVLDCAQIIRSTFEDHYGGRAPFPVDVKRWEAKG